MFKLIPTYDKKTGKQVIQFIGERPIDDARQFQRFGEIYKFKSLTFMNDNRKDLKPRLERTCRFCGKSHPDTTFKKDAHMVPRLIGNKHLLSDFECDICNQHFSKFEDSFANFIGLPRTLILNRNQEKIPTFKSPDENLVIRESDEKKGTLSIEKGDEHGLIEHDKENKKFIITSTKHSFIPIDVYKCLLKIAISLNNEKEIDYSKSLKLLMTHELDNQVESNPLLILHKYFIPGPSFVTPYIFNWTKKPEYEEKPYPTQTLVISFLNFVYQFFVVFNPQDDWFISSKERINLNIVPPFIDKEWIIKYEKPIPDVIDLSGKDKVKGQTENVSIKYL